MQQKIFLNKRKNDKKDKNKNEKKAKKNEKNKKEWRKKENINKMAKTRKKQANCGSKTIRSPKAASWPLRTKNLDPAGDIYRYFCEFNHSGAL